MLTFWMICALMILFALWFVLPPLFQGKSETKPDEARTANLLVYQDQHRELEADLKNGLLTEAQYQQDKEELERRLLAEVSDQKQAGSRAVATRKIGYVLAVAIPLAAIIFYFVVGNPGAAEDVRPANPSLITR
jgi:cytochrome c-type biogenesis protein CcmH